MEQHQQVKLTSIDQLSECESEDLIHKHFIQGYGACLVLDEKGENLVFHSKNLKDFLGLKKEKLSNNLKLIGVDGVDLIQLALKKSVCAAAQFLGYMEVDGSDYSLEVLSHRAPEKNYLVLEFVPYSPVRSSEDAHLNSLLLNQLSSLVSKLHFSDSLADFITDATNIIQEFLQYERVVLYKFNQDWSGEVLAEGVEAGKEKKYIGLHFPASDIPSQARALFSINPIRVIADVNQEKVEIISSSNEDEMFDQTYSSLRIASDFHLDYLKNMGSCATLTVSILVHGKLWGMLSCHHPEPRIPPFNHRQSIFSLITIIGHTFSNQLQSKLEIERLNHINRFNKNMEQFREMHKLGDIRNKLVILGQFLINDMECDGIGIFIGDLDYDDCLSSKGRRIVKETLRSIKEPKSFQSLSENPDYKDLFSSKDFVGGYFYPFKNSKGGGVFLARKEWLHTVNWAGKPNTFTQYSNKDGKVVLGVRNSFETWEELVKGQSKPWDLELSSFCDELENAVINLYVVDQLNYAKEKSEESIRTKSQFLANMSHEIRTPLNGIIGLTELAIEKVGDKEQLTHLNQVMKSSNLLMRVINDILDHSRLDSGVVDKEHQVFNHKESLETVVDLFIHASEANNNEIELNIAENVPETLIGDKFRVQQILNNIVGNSVKFTKNGLIKIKVSKGLEDDENIQIVYSVTDNGIGMDSKALGKLFKPFEQADNSITRTYGGSGLGLSITKKLVALLEGELSIQSELGKGTTCIFTIQYKKYIGDLKQENKDLESVALGPIKKSKNKFKILVVEDEVINIYVIKGHLDAIGLDFTVVENGQDAVNLAKNDKFDLILMDLHLPILNGYDASKQIREFNKEIPIVAVSAAAMPEDIIKCKEVGMNDHLSKPYLRDALIECLNKYLSLSS